MALLFLGVRTDLEMCACEIVTVERTFVHVKEPKNESENG